VAALFVRLVQGRRALTREATRNRRRRAAEESLENPASISPGRQLLG
jgi:hypothetical protein